MKVTCYAAITVIGLLLGGCTSIPLKKEKVITTTQTKYPAKSPQHIAFYLEKNSPERPYRIIGVGIVSKYNFIGMQRPEPAMHTIMRNLAASIGGDAIMNINKGNQAMEANIIAYEKVLI